MLSFEPTNGIPKFIVYGGLMNGRVIYIGETGNSDLSSAIDPSQCRYCEKVFSKPCNKNAHERYSCKFKQFMERDNGRSRNMGVEQYIFDGGRSFVIPDDGVLQLLPTLPAYGKVDTIYLSGKSGSGKSTFVNDFANEVLKLLPDYSVVLFSRYGDDKAFNDRVKNHMIKIPLDDKLCDEKIDIERDIKQDGSVVIFDDIDNSGNKKCESYVKSLRDELLKNYRSHSENEKSCYVLVTNHMTCDYRDTRTVLMECDFLVLFPSSGRYQNEYCLRKYVGLGKAEIDKVLKLASRWIAVHQSIPRYVVYEKGIMII